MTVGTNWRADLRVGRSWAYGRDGARPSSMEHQGDRVFQRGLGRRSILKPELELESHLGRDRLAVLLGRLEAGLAGG